MRLRNFLVLTVLVITATTAGFVWAVFTICSRLGYGDLTVPFIVLFLCVCGILKTEIKYKWSV